MTTTRNHLLLVSAVTTGLGVLAYQTLKGKSSKYVVPKDLLASPYGKEVKVALALALKAGSNMYAYCDEKGTAAEENHDLGIEEKGQPEDFCTKIDVENERLVADGLLEQFPSHKIIGEESTGTGTVPPLTMDPTWIIDPIDGTTNFASGLPMTCVSIGLCDGGRPIAGVVYAPMTDEVYLAVKGHGAYRNGVKITQRSNTSLHEAVVCFEFGYARQKAEITKMVSALQRIMEHGCRTTRQIGSGVLDLCYVATGRLDVVYSGVASEGWKPWDYCAGCVVVSEAGCAIESIKQTEGEAFSIYSKSLICAVSKSLLLEVRHVIAP